MIHISLALGLLSLGFISRDGSQASAAGKADGPVREFVLAGEELGIPEGLAHAMTAILLVEQELVRLGMPPMQDGVPTESGELYAKRIYSEGSEFLAFLEPRLETFDFRGTELPSMKLAIDSVVYDAGYRAAKEMLALQPEFDPASLLALYCDRVVRGEPMLGSETASAFHLTEQRTGALAPLGNGKTLGVLTWGLLYQEAFWASEERDREAFISQLLSHGFDSRFVAAVVRIAVEPPLVPAREALASEKGGHPIEGSLDVLRGIVGFTKLHEQQLMDDLRLVQEIKRLPGDDEDLDLRDFTVEELPDGGVRRHLTKRGHIKVWLPKMLDLVRRELYPGDYTLRLRHGETIEERTLFWKQVFGLHGYFAGRDEMLAELRAIFADQDDHPLTARILELQAQALASGLNEEEALELKSLEKERSEERIQTIELMTGLLASYGAGQQFTDMLETMSVTLPDALEPLGGAAVGSVMYKAWGAAAVQDTPEVVGDLAEYFDGDSVLSPLGAERFLYFVGPRGYPGGPALMERVFEEGTVREIAASISNSSWLKPQQIQMVTEELLERYDRPDCSALDRASITGGLISAILNQSDPKRAKADLLRTIEDGRWMDSQSERSWCTYLPSGTGVTMRRVRELFSAAEIKALVAEGKLAKGVL